MNRGVWLIAVVVMLAVTVFATPVKAGEGMLLKADKSDVLVQLQYHPGALKQLPESFIVALIEWIKQQQQLAYGGDATLLSDMKFKLNMRLLDIRLNKLLHTSTFAPLTQEHPLVERSVGKLVESGYVNTANVSGEGPLDTVVVDSDQAVVRTMHPAILIEKSPRSQQVVSGEEVTFSITVVNAGDVPLRGVSVSDPQVPDCQRELGLLTVGEGKTYRCNAIVEGDIDNIATATGYDPEGGAVEASAKASVDAINPSISIHKSPDQQRVAVGKPVIFTVTVTNTGDVPLHGVKVNDPQAPACQRVIDFLDVLDTVSYYCTSGVGGPGIAPDPVAAPVAQVGSARGELLYTAPFFSWLGCQLRQTQASLEVMGQAVFVGPCQADGGSWSFSAWKTS